MTGGVGFRIETVWLYVMEHDDGDDGIPAVLGPGGTWLPMVCTDQRRVDQFRPIAEQMAAEEGKPIRLMRFDQAVTLDVIGGPTEATG